MNSITKRWVRGSLLVTILMCLVAEAVFLYYSITNYYDGARRAMTTRTIFPSAQRFPLSLFHNLHINT